MIEKIHPRSPLESMDGWLHLPRYVDKIRLHLAGKLHRSYEPYLGRFTDGLWLTAAGVTHEKMLEVVAASTCDGEICDWVRQHVVKSDAEKEAFAEALRNRPAPGDAAAMEKFQRRKAQYGLGDRPEITTFVQLMDADEGRV